MRVAVDVDDIDRARAGAQLERLLGERRARGIQLDGSLGRCLLDAVVHAETGRAGQGAETTTET